MSLCLTIRVVMVGGWLVGWLDRRGEEERGG